MKFIILNNHFAPPDPMTGDEEEMLAPMAMEEPVDGSDEPSMPYLSLVRRQINNVISMKLILRRRGAE